jgi:hypothetical protein
MKNIALIMATAQAVNVEALPDVFGPNGKDY